VKIDEVARRLDTQVLDSGAGSPGEVSCAVASDRMSDLLEHASSQTLLVTNLATPQLLDMADLMDVPAVCITSTAPPDPAFAAARLRCRVALILSPLGPEETRRRLSELLGEVGAASP
jgi:hypothetical protein